MLKEQNLNYIQIEFNLKFENEGGPEILDELFFERYQVYKIKEQKWHKKINELINENRLGFYFIDSNNS